MLYALRFTHYVLRLKEHAMTYIPHTDANRREMLEAIGVQSLEELFPAVPEEYKFPELRLPAALSEMETYWELQGLSEANADVNHYACFLGAGAYNHYVPHTVDYVLQRGEFYTAYTPYQPEVSQGTLQAMFEYQSMICQLTGMDVSNASHYDGATSLAEGVLLALNATKGNRKKVVISPAVHPQYRSVLRTYTQGMGVSIAGDDNLKAGIADLVKLLDKDTACLVVQSPSFFGQIENMQGVAEAVHAVGALLIVATDPIGLGLLTPPGEYGADVVVAEGQPLGIPLSYGGPYLGLFATKNAYVRKMAGRLVGQTVDADGKRGFVLTLSTREQHIRREKATSNICTNQGLLALANTIHLALLGAQGMRDVATQCLERAHHLAERAARVPGVSLLHGAPFFREFVLQLPGPATSFVTHALGSNLLAGVPLSRFDRGRPNDLLVAVTEKRSREEMDRYVATLTAWVASRAKAPVAEAACPR